jgi:hydroxyacylglutathione hydrolase
MKLTDNVHILPIDFEIAITPEKRLPRFVNVLLIFGDKITLVDTGVKGTENKIFEYIRQNNRNASEIDSIILSHSHPDHIGNAAKIKEITGCKLFAHQLEADWIEDIELQNKLRPVPGFFNLVDRSVKVDEYLSHGQKMVPGKGITLKFIHSPGHSKGSLNILFEEDKILFTADSIPLKNDIPNYDSYVDLMNSLTSIKNNSQYTLLLTSWTPPITDNNEIKRILNEGEEYLRRIDSVVKDCYIKDNIAPLSSCKCAVEKLDLPPFLINPLVDKAFRSHLM